MNTKKLCAFTSAGLVAGLALTLVLLSANKRKGLSPMTAQDPQTLVFNSESNVLGNSEGSKEIETLYGNKIGFTFSRLYLLEDHWQRMISDGYFYNTTPLSGISSMRMYFTGAAPTVMFGYDIGGECVYNLTSGYTLENGVAYDFDNAKPDYIKVSLPGAAEDLDITSMTISYDCERTEDKDLRKIDVYDPTPVNGGEGDANANKGKIYYWHDDSTFTNMSVSAGVLSFDHTAGGAWYGRQLFYSLPYANSGDTIHLETTITSDVAGSIQLNGQAYELEADTPKLISIPTFVGQGGQALTAFTMQLGIPSAKLASGHFSMTLPKIYSKAAVYHDVTFRNGMDEFAADYVRDGKVLNSIPAGPAPAAGYIFKGWYNGENKLTPATTITSDIVYTARFIDEASADKYTVTFVNIDDVGESYTEQVVETLSPKGDTIEYPFSYVEYKFFSDSAGNDEVQLANLSIEANTTLYYRAKVNYLSGYDQWATFESNVSWSAEGYLKFNRNCSTFTDPTTDSWHIQMSFGYLPNDVAKHYDLTFTYDIAVAGAYYTIYNDGAGAAYGQGAITDGNNQTLVVSYDGADIPDNTRFQWGFGAMASTDDVNLVIKSVSLAESAI